MARAQVTLADFSKGALTAQQRLDGMNDKFSGRKLIQDATLAAQAVADIGGAAKLTQKELEQVGNQARAAVQKMKLLGLEPPANLQKIADTATKASGSLTGMLGSASKLAGGLGIAFGTGAIIGFGKAVLANADALVKMSDKTGITIGGLQKFQVAGDDAGNTLDEITSAVTKMQDKLVSGDASAVGGLKKLGLSLDDIRQLSPEKQFTLISDAIRGIRDPSEQVAIAIDIFGRAGASVLPTLKRGFDDLKDASVGMSDEATRALDTFGDMLTSVARRAKNFAGELAGQLITQLVITGGVVSEAQLQIKRLIDTVNAPVNTNKDLGPLGLPREAELDRWGLSLEAIRKKITESEAASKKAATESQKFAESLANLNDVTGGGGGGGGLSGNIKEAIKYFLQLGASQSDLARVFGVTEGAVKSVANELKRVTEESKIRARVLEIETAGWEDVGEAFKNAITNSFDPRPFAAVLRELDKIERSIKFGVTKGLEDLGAQYQPLDDKTKKIVQDHEAWVRELANLAGAFGTLSQISGGAFSGIVADIGNIIGAINLATKAMDEFNAARARGDRLGQAAGIVSGVASVGQATGQGGRVARVVGGAVSGALVGGAIAGAVSGGAAGSVVPLWGTLIGAGVGAAIGWWRSRKANKQFKELRDVFIKESGGLSELNARAAEAGITINDLLDAKTPQEYNAAITRINESFKKFDDQVKRVNDGVTGLSEAWQSAGEFIPASIRAQVDELRTMNGLTDEQRQLLDQMAEAAIPNYAKMTELAETYGITLDGLGERFQQESITAKALQIVKDFEQLQDAGANVGGVLLGMSDEIQALLDSSARFGALIPDNMRPLIENLINAGQLTDESGNKLTDISQIDFGATPLDRSTSAIVDAIRELKEALLALPGAAATAASGISSAFSGVTYNTPQAPDRELDNVANFSRGTRGRVLNFGSGTLAMLHGRERVQTAGEVSSGDALSLKVDALIEATDRQTRYLTQDFSRETARIVRQSVA